MKDYMTSNTKPHGDLGIHGQEQLIQPRLNLEVEIDEGNGETTR